MREEVEKRFISQFCEAKDTLEAIIVVRKYIEEVINEDCQRIDTIAKVNEEIEELQNQHADVGIESESIKLEKQSELKKAKETIDEKMKECTDVLDCLKAVVSKNNGLLLEQYKEEIKKKLKIIDEIKELEIGVATSKKEDLQRAFDTEVAKLDAADKEKIEKIGSNIAKYESEKKSIETTIGARIKESIDRFFDDKDIEENIIQMENSANGNFKEYKNPNCIPDSLTLGRLQLNTSKGISKDRRFLYEIVFDCLKKSSSKLIDKQKNISLPFIQGAHEGASFLFCSKQEKIKDIIRSFILKVLVSFPAGKIELLRIDSRNENVLSPFTGLSSGDVSNNKLNSTRILISEEEISKELSETLKTQNDLINRYGTESLSQIKKREEMERFHLITIASFPLGFTNSALKNLCDIVEKARRTGYFIIISTAKETIMSEYYDDSERNRLIKKIMEGCSVIRIQENYSDISIRKEGADNQETVDLFLEGCTYDECVSTVGMISKEAKNLKPPIISLSRIGSEVADEEEWLSFSTIDEISIPVGLYGYDEPINLVLGRMDMDDRHHVLIEGRTGKGKSTLLQTIITSALLKYDSSEIEIYYLDYKDGMNSIDYSKHNLSAFKVISADSEREFGMITLEKLEKIMNDRIEAIREYGENIKDYRENTGNTMPKILVIIDEYESLVGIDDDISTKCINSLCELTKKGRAEGIHVFLADQKFGHIDKFQHNMSVRFAFEGSSSLLDISQEDFDDLFKNSTRAVYNDSCGSRNGNKAINVVSLKNEFDNLLSRLSGIENYNETYGEREEIKVFHSHIDDDYRHPFNCLTGYLNGTDSIEDSIYPLYLGEFLDYDSDYGVLFSRKKERNHLLIFGYAERMMNRLLFFTVLSLLNDNLTNNRYKNQNIYMIDFNSHNSTEGREMIKAIYEMGSFKEQFAYVEIKDSTEINNSGIEQAKSIIDTIYGIYLERAETEKEMSQFFLIINGVEYAHILSESSVYSGTNDILGLASDVKDSLGKVKELLKYGSIRGIHCIVTSANYEQAEDNLEKGFEKMFNYRIAFKLDESLMKKLVRESRIYKLRETTAIFHTPTMMKNRKFKIYSLPSTKWIQGYAKRYQELCKE